MGFTQSQWTSCIAYYANLRFFARLLRSTFYVLPMIAENEEDDEYITNIITLNEKG